MNSKQIIGTILGGITTFLLGWLFYGILLSDTFAGMTGSATGVMRSDSDMVYWALIVGNLVLAYLYVYIFSNWANISTFMGGMTNGAMIGGLIALGFNLIMYATTNISQLSGALLDVVVSAVMWGIAGGVIAWWLGRK